MSTWGSRHGSDQSDGAGPPCRRALVYGAAVPVLLIAVLVLAARPLSITPVALVGFPVVVLAATALILLLLAIHGGRGQPSRGEFGQDEMGFAGVQQRLMANISHELRTPLNVVLGYSEMLRDGVLGELTDQQADAIQECHEAGQRILRMINDILDIGRARSYALPSDPQPLAPGEFMERVVLLLEGQARAADVSLETEVPDDLPTLEADERRLKQVLYHLALSSIIRSAEGQTIHIRAALGDEVLLVSIADHGPQMSDADITRVAVEAPGAVAEEGAPAPNAVGLPLCVALARDLGGHLAIASDAADTTFSLALPITSPDA